MTAPRTHFADDHTLAYISRLERELAAAQVGVDRYKYVRRLNVQQFKELFTKCLHGARFDDEVDAAIDASIAARKGEK